MTRFVFVLCALPSTLMSAVGADLLLNANGGTGGTKSVKVVCGGDLPEVVPPTKGGWVFDGYWTTVKPGGMQYYGADGTGVRPWDREGGATLWAKWNCQVKLGRNGGEGGSSYVTATFGQPLPDIAVPKKPGWTFGGYYTSSIKMLGKWFNADGTSTGLRWTSGGTPSVYAFWLRDWGRLSRDILLFALVVSVLLLAARFQSRACYFAALIATLLFTLPQPVFSILPGLDPTYQWLVSRFAFTDVWGCDVVFTYGPLGFLVAPQQTLANVLCGMAFNLLCAMVFAYVCASLFGTGSVFIGRAVAWMLLILAVCPWTGGSMEWKWSYLSILSVAVVVFDGVRNERGRTLLLAFAAFSAVVLTLSKFSMFVAVVPQQLALLGWHALRSRGRSWREAVVYFACTGLVLCVAVALLFPSFHAFALWARGSYEMSYGYNQYMICDKSALELALPFVLSLCALFGLVWRNPRRWNALFFAFLFSPVLFCAYKYAVVRHINGLAPFAHMLAGVCLLLPLAMRTCVKRGALLAVIAILFALLSMCIYSSGLLMSGVSVNNLLATVMPSQSLNEASEQSKIALQGMSLPQGWKERIGTNSVMIAGSDYGIIMESGLCLRPLPALQLYSAYTRYLDEICAESLRSVSRPGSAEPPCFLMLPAFPMSIDKRNTYLDNPAFWREVRRRYAIVEVGAEYILLERREASVEPDSHMPVFRVELEPSLAGRVCSFLFRATPLYLEVLYQDGTTREFAYNPLWANAEPQVMSIPASPDEVIAFLGGAGSVKQISGMRVFARAPWHYRRLEVKCYSNH